MPQIASGAEVAMASLTDKNVGRKAPSSKGYAYEDIPKADLLIETLDASYFVYPVQNSVCLCRTYALQHINSNNLKAFTCLRMKGICHLVLV